MKILTEKNFSKLKEIIKKSKGDLIFSSNDDEFNRKVIEKLPIHTLLINQLHRKDYSKQRNSGFNQVMAKIAKKAKISIGINLDEIIESKGSKKAKILARIKQNIKLTNKNKIKMKFISLKFKKDERDLKALGLALGMPTWMTKNIF
jgi:RNase P/RNase MRP subunit p30